jgi:GDP-L-fucose synthase
MNKNSKLFITGALTMEGKVLISKLKSLGYSNIIFEQNSKEKSLREIFSIDKPEFVFLLGESSGGIKANIEKPASLMLANLIKIIDVISLSLEFKVEKLLLLASSCVYPKHIVEPMSPEMLMSGYLEPTNSGYATAKLTGLELVKSIREEFKKDFISCISSNCFGPHDDFISEDAHVISALTRRMHESKLTESKNISIWGSGDPVRDFLYVEDLADGLIFLMLNYSGSNPVNISSGKGTSIKNLALKIKDIVGYKGEVLFDSSKPDGMMHKVLDSQHINKLGWNSKFSLDIALQLTYDWHLKNTD